MLRPWWVLPLAGSLALGGDAAPATLPDGPLIVGYQDWGRCNISETLAAVSNGVNVIVWFAVNLAIDGASGEPTVQGGPDYDCVAMAMAALIMEQTPTVHLISVGGWNAPHPETSLSGEEWFQVWRAWNSGLPVPFDGIDWDLEGHSDHDAPSNTLTLEALHVVVDMSVAAKAAGYVVTMAPAQSYLDTESHEFSLSLLKSYPEWHPEFLYRGHNSYAYLLLAAPPGTFDLVLVQLYESWSRAGQGIQQRNMPGRLYLQRLAAQYINGWEVDFTPEDGANSTPYRVSGRHTVRLDPSQLLLGFVCGDPSEEGRLQLFDPSDVASAHRTAEPGLRPRGYFFWNMHECGEAPTTPSSTQTVNLGPAFNEFLHTRGGGRRAVQSGALGPGPESSEFLHVRGKRPSRTYMAQFS